MLPDAKVVVGVDESGRGSLAGPLVLCATAFLREDSPPTAVYRTASSSDKVLVVKDSKLIKNPLHREMLDTVIRSTAHAYAVIERSNKEIDARLMYHVYPEALKLVIARCIEKVVERGQYTDPRDFLVLIDGEVEVPKGLPCQVLPIPDGDKLMWQIGAASIIAKVACDARMIELDKQFPKYNFAKHKGYGVPEHKQLLTKHGPCSAHRHTFAPVQKAKGLTPGFEEF